MQFDISNPCSSSLVCAAHFKPWSSAARGGEVGEEQVGAPLVCEGLGRAGCGMDARTQDKEMALLLCCHCSPGCLTYSYLYTCPTQTRASPPSFQELSALQAGRCWQSVPQQQPQLPGAVLVPGCHHGPASSAVQTQTKSRMGKDHCPSQQLFLPDLL